MRSLLLVAAVLAAPLLAACDSSGPVVAPLADAAPVTPLEVGGQWTFSRAYTVSFGEDGVVRDTTRRESSRTETLTVTRDTVVAGERFYRIVSSRGLRHCVFGGAGWFANRPEGLVRWTESPADAELVYALGVEPDVPFVETPVVVAVLDERDAAYTLPSGPVEGARYTRTWRRIELDDALPEPIRGPIRPTMTSSDVLSPDLGPVLLEVAYARDSRQDDGTFVPSSRDAYELQSYSVGEESAPAPLADGGGAEGPFAVR